jgi:hypothetical protein
MQKELDLRTIDSVSPGQQQSEIDHHFRGQNTSSGENNGGAWRHALNGGSFSYQMKVGTGKKNILRIKYWGGDAGNRIFDIFVDDRAIARQVLENNQPGKFFDVDYVLGPEMTQGKKTVEVRLQALPEKAAGGAYGLRILKP